MNFSGIYAAVCTPFSNGEIDVKAYEDYIEWLISEDIDGIVVCGSTGESSMLSFEEHVRLINITKDIVKNRITLIANCGANSTKEAIYLTLEAQKLGVDAVLSVVPYYVRPTQEGIYEHFKAIHDSSDIPLLIYNVPSRTAADILNSYSEEDLARVLYMYGEMNNSRQIARKIVKARSQKAIERTEELVDLAIGNGRWAIGDGGEIEVPTAAKKDLAKLFQALRIEVNDEMGALREMLLAAKDLLRPGGRIAILTYHSLEDRIVKNFLRSGNLEGTIEKDFYGNILSPFRVIEKGATASAEEVERNPRARSAKLRVAEKL